MRGWATPVYRVYLWHQPAAPAGIRQEQIAYHCDEYRLCGATDVHEVVSWAETTARPEQTLTLYVEHLNEGRLGLIHLAGQDPTVTAVAERLSAGH